MAAKCWILEPQGPDSLPWAKRTRVCPLDGNPLVPGGLAEWMRSFIRISLSTGQNTSKMGLKPLCSKRWQLSKQEFMQRNANTYPPALRHIPGMERQAAPTTAMTTP